MSTHGGDSFPGLNTLFGRVHRVSRSLVPSSRWFRSFVPSFRSLVPSFRSFVPYLQIHHSMPILYTLDTHVTTILLKSIFHKKPPLHWIPNANQSETNNMKLTCPMQTQLEHQLALAGQPHSITKETCISFLKIAKIGINIKELRRTLKVEKRVLFLFDNSRKVEKGGRFWTSTYLFLLSKSLFFFIYFIYLCLLIS